MKPGYGLLFGAGIVIIFSFLAMPRHQSESRDETSVPTIPTSQTLPARLESPPTHSIEVQTSIKPQLQQRLVEIDSLMTREHLDKTQILNQILNEGIDSVRRKISAKLKRKLEELKSLIDEQNIETLRADGFNDKLFELNPVLELSQKYQTRNAQLKEYALPLSVRNLVEELSGLDEILDQDLQNLVDACNNRKDCIEKSATLLMDANHIFSDQQISLLENSFREREEQ